VALEPVGQPGNMQASGSIMSLSNYSDGNIVQKCVQQNCFVDIFATVFATSSSIQAHITFQAQNPNATLETIGYFGVQLYGALEPTSSETARLLSDFDQGEVLVNGERLEDYQIEHHSNGVIKLRMPKLYLGHGDNIVIKKRLLA